ncbi:tripartite tricarboxylate transporter substrate binding protein [Roseomonas frigidaquae]|uniref:Tripartite tricarboxylate transporter substrate binding protein n=1 Tax=Falsiroseomonas frigidaquae TaxID=487318 RepID=A0ABX1ES74_9PROT|nr:tripartite tricarboxylate transporter substrate binding protein [Falsiroseomonas frigidaquae]NKE43148.1 tripartite tricarboxylate transporter substrate binding protein [Falsiroseomonas frigidaquae]
MLKRRILVTSTAATAALLAAPHAWAQPRGADQTVRIIVPFPPGGPADIVGRLLARALTGQLGQTFVVENRAGAGGVIGIEAVARARPDGTTLGIGSSGALSVLPNLMPRMPYQVERDIQPISLAISVPQVLAVHPSVQARSVAELVALARRQPGTLAFASSGSGNSLHLAAELFRARAGGIELMHVPYRGAAPAVTDLIAGQVQLMFGDVPVMLPHVQSGAIRALAVTAAERSPALPDVPTMAEAGVNGVESESYYGLIGPTGMPAERVAELHRAVRNALQDPATRQPLLDQGGRLIGSSPEEFAAHIRREGEKWAEVIRFSGARLE